MMAAFFVICTLFLGFYPEGGYSTHGNRGPQHFYDDNRS